MEYMYFASVQRYEYGMRYFKRPVINRPQSFRSTQYFAASLGGTSLPMREAPPVFHLREDLCSCEFSPAFTCAAGDAAISIIFLQMTPEPRTLSFPRTL